MSTVAPLLIFASTRSTCSGASPSSACQAHIGAALKGSDVFLGPVLSFVVLFACTTSLPANFNCQPANLLLPACPSCCWSVRSGVSVCLFVCVSPKVLACNRWEGVWPDLLILLSARQAYLLPSCRAQVLAWAHAPSFSTTTPTLAMMSCTWVCVCVLAGMRRLLSIECVCLVVHQ